jgi:hypothetical protein
MRSTKAIPLSLVGCYLAAGVLANHRAYFPVGSVSIVVSQAPLCFRSRGR